MGFINVAERTINAKLVYYGVGVGGKTTSLQQVHGIFCPRNEVQLVSINTEEDSTLLFDFLPINLGQVGGFKIRIQGFTVPGQPKYRQMRKYVLQGADAVVFVVDSQRSRLQENLESLQSMRENLRTSSGTSENVPIVVQYNKRDLPDILSEEELDRQFRFRPDVEAFPSVATEGHGVFETFVQATSMLVEKKVELYGLGRGKTTARDVAEEVRRKLWEICDEVRRSRSTVAIDNLPQTRLALADDEGVPIPVPAPKAKDVASEPRREHGIEEKETEPATAGRTPAAPGGLGIVVGEEGDFSYQLRETSRAGAEPMVEVLTDAELDLDLSAGSVDFDARPEAEVDDSLLDKTVRSNLELAQRFGEVDQLRLLWERKANDLVDIAQQTVHDLNRPLSAVRLMLSTLDKGYLGSLSSPVHQAVQNGLMAVNQMERLVRDLLDSSRLDHDGMRLDFAPCDLTLLLADVLRTLRYEIDERDVRLRVESLPVITADAWALTKVFMNLVGNAIAYGPADALPIVSIFAEDGEHEWRIGVRDNGIGIPEQDRPRLFRRFERGSNTGGVSGTGLGLHIVKEIVQGHGGFVTFESEVGRGTTFVLHLPKQPRQPRHSPISETALLADL
ncbi:MAG TPA: ATP-binding protein [Planctomycetota bacterium]|nr:ATP-binding protein [Planctomycetota bacterium]